MEPDSCELICIHNLRAEWAGKNSCHFGDRCHQRHSTCLIHQWVKYTEGQTKIVGEIVDLKNPNICVSVRFKKTPGQDQYEEVDELECIQFSVESPFMFTPRVTRRNKK